MNFPSWMTWTSLMATMEMKMDLVVVDLAPTFTLDVVVVKQMFLLLLVR